MKLEEIEKICDETPPGPWEAVDGGIDIILSNGNRSRLIADKLVLKKYRPIVFAAMARTELPKLLAVAKAAKSCFTEEEGYILDEVWKTLEELEKE